MNRIRTILLLSAALLLIPRFLSAQPADEKKFNENAQKTRQEAKKIIEQQHLQEQKSAAQAEAESKKWQELNKQEVAKAQEDTDNSLKALEKEMKNIRLKAETEAKARREKIDKEVDRQIKESLKQTAKETAELQRELQEIRLKPPSPRKEH